VKITVIAAGFKDAGEKAGAVEAIGPAEKLEGRAGKSGAA